MKPFCTHATVWHKRELLATKNFLNIDQFGKKSVFIKNSYKKEGRTMGKAKKVKEISFEMPNRVGLLAEVTAAIAGAKVNVNAICAYGMEGTGYFMLTTNSNAKAKKALAPLGVAIEERDVVEVEVSDKPGELQKIAKKVADAGIDIEYMYATAGSGKKETCIFLTSDNVKAIKAVNR
ncbi:MAG: ACT domain-containing protein [Deltaproteobacteria bacterium]|nr:ACT domain-containing protein [Deltaproteobacteria bacterium]